MALEQLEMGTGFNKVELAINLLQSYEPKDGYYLAFSGGKDSVAIYDLAQKAGVKFDAHYCVSPIDPPQIYKFIKEYYPDVIWDYHAKGFWGMVVINDLPRRQARWCCRIIKEAGGEGRVVVVGNRRAESTKRNKQCFIEYNSRGTGKSFIRPILHFDNYDIWQYIRENNLPYCSLYDEGFKRIGCVLCPYDTHIERAEQYFPKIVNNWKRACDRLVEQYKLNDYKTKSGKPQKRKFENGEELYQWWVGRR